MSQNSCQTVEIQGPASEENPSGIVVINESDFDAETMTLANPTETQSAPVELVPTPTPTPTPTEPEHKAAKTAKAVAPWAAATKA